MTTPAERRAAAAEGPRLGDLTALLVRHSRQLAADYALLAVLDARMAAVRYVWVIAAGVIAAVLVVTAWLSLVVAGAVWLIGTGMSSAAALLLGAGVNVAAALALAVWIRGAATELPFAATLRQLRGELPSGPEASHADPA
jgi:hypothetical protein